MDAITITGQQNTYTPIGANLIPAQIKAFVTGLITSAHETTIEKNPMAHTIIVSSSYIDIGQLEQLKSEIGIDLYEQLSLDERSLIINTSGKLNLEKNVNIDRMFKSIENYRKNGE